MADGTTGAPLHGQAQELDGADRSTMTKDALVTAVAASLTGDDGRSSA